MTNIIISFITADRPGIVESLSDIINKHSGNWQKSSLHHMSGFFSGVIEISVPESNNLALSNELSQLANFKMHIEKAAQEKSAPTTQLILELTANDRAGIVQEISSVIHRQGGNLLKLVSTQESAAHSGHSLFKAKVTITSIEPNVDALIEALEHLADDLMVDISR